MHFFLYGLDPKSGPGATGFFVARMSEVLEEVCHIYAVSNRHAVNPFSCIRINKNNDETRFIEFDPSEWIFSDTNDLAIVDVTDFLDFDLKTFLWQDDIRWINEYNFVTEEVAFYRNIGIGDQTVMIGLFADHDGGKKNIPVGRFGLLAATPDDSTPVRLWPADPFARPAYLNDMRSRSGFSGSPVWVWRTPYDDMNQVGFNGPAKMFHPRNGFLYLAGIHRGQFREQTVIQSLEAERSLQSGDKIEIASSMTVVIPAWEITTLLDKAAFQKQRTERDSRVERTGMAAALGRGLRSLE